ncbi:tetratricopeptide repeat protein 14 homolog isoform X1 [Anopheles darlingi]|uniref:tetratricopeptide repeat protein 14 homolog isoform X1 n=2 Tax=Anopheles darlingi TaxID=43151 RepID=UPI00210056AE|nr:tetratricopeptide repeat protein 14 homolog isoform X1 [Anopheles darlingi]XP_049533164.1 tetratricopeptide repeat protein 14 homolog isoform X1 [Anopheles darlingi]
MSQHQLNRALVERALGYHGKPLQNIWEAEREDEELLRLGIGPNPDFSVYTARQKHLTFQERTKRLMLHQFMVKKASILYDRSLTVGKAGEVRRDDIECKEFCLPPMEVFMGVETIEKTDHLLETVQPGDVVYGSLQFLNFGGMVLQPMVIVGNVRYYVRNKALKATIAKNQMVPPKPMKGHLGNYTANDIICCEVIDVGPSALRLICTMIRSARSRVPESVVYGLVAADELPPVFKQAENRTNETYGQLLEKSPSFRDPRYVRQLAQDVGLDLDEFYTNMSGLKGRYSSQEYASELRNAQASKWAFRSVAEGIEHFKEGRHSEAFQCLNKALSIDPRNVEGLVARGALYANSGSFKKAVEDFETALKLNPSHANARKYMGETLVALGRSYEDENRIEEAKKAYQDCLNIIPHHEEAQTSLDFLKTKPIYGKQIVEPTELELPALNIVKPSSSDRNKQEPDTSGVGGSGLGLVGVSGSSSSKRDNSESTRKERKKESKKDRKKRHKKHQSSSSDSSSDSSDSSDSSSDSSSSSSDSSSTSDSSGSRNKRRKRSKNEKKLKSLSPLSKRMSAAIAGGGRGATAVASDLVGYPIGGPAVAAAAGSVFSQSSSHGQSGFDDYEQKVRKFLEMPRDEENYEEKVRRFVAEATKYQKERKQLEDKSRKKKKKDEKKAKKDSKKKRKSDEKKKSKKKDKSGAGDDEDKLDKDKLREALKIFENFPVLDELGSKLGEYYAKLEKQQTNTAAPGGGSAAKILSALLGTANETAGSSASTSAGALARGKEEDSFRNSKFKVCLSSGLVTESSSPGKGSVLTGGKSSDMPPDHLEHQQPPRGSGAPVPAGAADDHAKDGKWRMMFNKDKRPAPGAGGGPAKDVAAAAGTSMSGGMGAKQQHAFGNESDEEAPPTTGSSWGGGKGSGHYSEQRSGRFGANSSRYDDRGRGPSTERAPPTVKSGPVVLDKFGNFRLADAPVAPGGGGANSNNKPPEPSAAPPSSASASRRSRSKSRHRTTYGSSRSRSRSRSDRRRSRSGSFRRRFSRSRSRSFSRSRSGSYSRSRSRSRSFERRRYDRRFYRGGRGGGGYGGDRMGGPFGGNRFNNPRGHFRRGGFRDFRDNRFIGRGGGGGGGGRDRPPFRPRYRGRYQRSYSRSTSKSPDRRPISPGDDRPRYRDNRRGDSRDRSQPRRGASRDSRDGSRDRHRRGSDDRDSPKRSKERSPGVGGEGGDRSRDRSLSPTARGTGKSKRHHSRSVSRSPQSTGSSSNKNVPNDIEGRWADRDEQSPNGKQQKQQDEEEKDKSVAGTATARNRNADDSGIADDRKDKKSEEAGATDNDVLDEEYDKILLKARKDRKE